MAAPANRNAGCDDDLYLSDCSISSHAKDAHMVHAWVILWPKMVHVWGNYFTYKLAR